VDSSLFEEVADALRGMLPPELGGVRLRVRRYGLKAWFGAPDPPREHYEAQVIGPKGVTGAKTLAIEIGFHAEHPKVGENRAVVTHLLEQEKEWRKTLRNAVAGPFIGRAQTWQRVSETWPDPNLDDPELAIEVAAQLADYITVLEPRRGAT
jgi:hypothetical protein